VVKGGFAPPLLYFGCSKSECLNKSCVSAKLKDQRGFIEFEIEGIFMNIIPNTYVYIHNTHAAFSNVKYSQSVKIMEDKNHGYHG